MGQPLKLYYIDLDGKEVILPFREAHLLQIDEMNHILEEIKFNKNENVIRFRDLLIKMLLKDEDAGILTGPVLSKEFEEEFHRFPKICQGFPKYESENIGLIYQEEDRLEKMSWNTISSSRENFLKAQSLLKDPEIQPLKAMKEFVQDELSGSREVYGPRINP